jgi:hypothetical protein
MIIRTLWLFVSFGELGLDYTFQRAAVHGAGVTRRRPGTSCPPQGRGALITTRL